MAEHFALDGTDDLSVAGLEKLRGEKPSEPFQWALAQCDGVQTCGEKHVTYVASEPEFGPVPETLDMARAANRKTGIGRRGSA